MTEPWQLYDEQGNPLSGQGETKEAIFSQGLLHAASHVWIWRPAENNAEILLQKRAANKKTWPNCLDISAAGHIDLDEDPIQAALRETKEEINLDLKATNLKLVGVHRAYLVAENNKIENEFQWLYIVKLSGDTDFIVESKEVAGLEWKSLDNFQQETRADNQSYVPHGNLYYETITTAIRAELQK